MNSQPLTHEQILEAMAKHGSIRKTAQAIGITPQAISDRFSLLSAENPLRIRYEALKGRRGRPRQYQEGIEGDRERVKKAVQKFRQKNN